LIERLLRVLPESPASYSIWKQLVVRHAVLGVQVHDARLVALMQAHNVTHIQPRGLPSLPQHHRHLSDGPPRCSSPGPGSLVLNVQSIVLRTLSRSSQNSRASERRPRCHRTRNSRWPTADKSPLGPPTALLVLARCGGQGRTGAVIDGQNPLALAACPPKTARRIGGVPWPKADKMEPRGQRVTSR
jgi:hypothetical protein